jgi:hypothetical protein
MVGKLTIADETNDLIISSGLDQLNFEKETFIQ